MRDAYAEQVRGLLDGGVDILLLETIFDTLNAKAAHRRDPGSLASADSGVPACHVMISVTITDRSGRTLSGQTIDAFYLSIEHAKPFSVGMNCALGAREMRPYLAELGAIADGWVSAIPTPACRMPSASTTSSRPRRASSWASSHRPASPTSSAAAAARRPITSAPSSKAVGQASSRTRTGSNPVEPARTVRGFPVSRPLAIRPDSNFQMIGERTNVTGSKRFARLVKAGDWAEAAQVALDQVRGGANMIDVNMDEGMLDSERAMTTFLNYIATEPEIARLPVMIDSSKWSVLEAGLKCVQGKAVVNSISLKEGEEDFLAEGADGPPLRRRRRRDGVRRAGPGRHHRAEGRDLPARIPSPDRAGRPSIRRTSSSIPTSSRSRPASRSTPTTR